MGSALDLGRLSISLFSLAVMVGAASLVTAPPALADGHEFSGYITSTALNVRANPGTKSEVVGILLKYDPVTVTAASNVGSTNWYSIKASGGYTTGWVSARFVTRGDPPTDANAGPVDYGAQETPTLMRGPHKYVGAKTCQECHEDAVGDYPDGATGVWAKHFHSGAYRSLKRDYTREIAQRARGIDDPTTDWRCVKCHVTALGADPSQLGPDYTHAEGVGCEVCHGPGGTYAEEDHGPDVANRAAMGFRVLRNLDDRREVCTSCHNTASPTYKPFDLRQFSRKIAHWVDDDDDAYRAEAGRESQRRTQSVTKAASTTAATATAAGSAAAEASANAAAQARAEAARQVAQAQAEAKAASERAKAAAADQAAQEAAEKAAETARADEARAEAERKAAAAMQAKADAEAKARAAADEKVAQAAAAKQEAERRAAAAAEKAKQKADADAAAAAAQAAAAPPPAQAAKANPLAHFLEDVDDVITLNTDGVKYQSIEILHRKHAGNDYLPGGDCQTCHHTQEDDESPESCNSCHDIGGDAEEEKAKKRYAHNKKKRFPKAADQEEVSCTGCHVSMNKMLAAGERKGEKAPTKCTTCHEKQ